MSFFSKPFVLFMNLLGRSHVYLRMQNARIFAAVLIVLVTLTMHGFAQAGGGSSTEVQRLHAEADAAEKRGDIATAIEKYKGILKLSPSIAPAYNNLGMLYFNEQDYPHAAEVLARGLKINPEMPTASAMLGLSYWKMGEEAKAKPHLEKALATRGGDETLEDALAHVLITLHDYAGASAQLRKMTERNPKNQQALYLLGKCYLELAQSTLAKVREIDPDSVISHEIAGEIDESMGNFDGAMVEYNKAVQMAPKQPGTHMHLGDAYRGSGKWESARAEFAAELVNDPGNCTARWKMANASLEANQPAESVMDDLNKSIERCPGLMQARVDRARALIKLNRQAEAFDDLILAEKATPDEPSIHFMLSRIYKSQGKTAEAQQELAQYGELQRKASERSVGEANDALTIKNNTH